MDSVEVENLASIVCSICSCRSEFAADIREHVLPVSRIVVATKLRSWWLTNGRSRRCNLDTIDAHFHLPVCSPCLDLVVDIDRLENRLSDYLSQLWNRLETSTYFSSSGVDEIVARELQDGGADDELDVIRAAALAAGILDDSSTPDEPSRLAFLPKEDFDSSSVTSDTSQLVVRKTLREKPTLDDGGESMQILHFGTIVVEKHVPESSVSLVNEVEQWPVECFENIPEPSPVAQVEPVSVQEEKPASPSEVSFS
jgi:hypothetical protein